MGNMHLVTGYQGQEHVTAADHGSLYAAIFGSGSYVLDRGNKLAATAITSNQIRIADGDIILQGRHIRLNEGKTIDLTIENGSQGYKRNDLIVARYTRNASTGIEEASLVVIKGTAASSDPVDPEYTDGDLLADNAETVDFPLYRIPLDGITVGTPVQLFDVAYLATLNSDKEIPTEYLPSMDYIPAKQKGVANGVASLDGTGKVPSAQLPTLSSSVTSTSTTTPANSYAVKQAYDRASSYVSAQKGVANGIAGLDSSGKVPTAQLPSGLAVTSGSLTVTPASSLYNSTSPGGSWLKIGSLVVATVKFDFSLSGAETAFEMTLSGLPSVSGSSVIPGFATTANGEQIEFCKYSPSTKKLEIRTVDGCTKDTIYATLVFIT